MSRELPRPELDNWSTWIAGYRAVVHDADGQASRVFAIEAGDDNGALALARERAGALAFELWDALCLIGRFEPMP